MNADISHGALTPTQPLSKRADCRLYLLKFLPDPRIPAVLQSM